MDESAAEPRLERDGPGIELLLADLVAGFVDPLAPPIDIKVDAALARIAQALGVDRASLFRFGADPDPCVLTHVWDARGLPQDLPQSIANDFPWTLARLRQGHPVVFARDDELPPEAAVDRQSWRALGVGSKLIVPARVGGQVEGALSIACAGRRRDWPADVVERIAAIADVLVSALAHQRTRESLDTAVRFERVVADTMANLLTSAPGEQRHRIVGDALRELGLLLGAEGATLWERQGRAFAFRATHRWIGSELWQPPESADQSLLPWIVPRVIGGESVRFRRLADLPAAAQADMPVLRAVGVRSMIVVPIVCGRATVRALCFAVASVEREFPAALLPRVRLLGEVISAVLDRDEAERREREAEAQAVHAVRVGAMGTLVASLAHELTQPLTASLANAETALRLLDAPQADLGELRAALADIVADEQRARELVLKLRRFLKRGEAERRPFDVGKAITEALDLSGKQARSHAVALRCAAIDAPLWSIGDRVQIEQLVLNLLTNAIEAASTAARREVVVEATGGEGSVRIVVSDSGTGMDEATLAQAFRPFFTTRREGMGLGLSICRTIAESHGGSVAAQSKPGVGSRFTVLLPQVSPAASPPAVERTS